ncbi:HAD-IB family hydrolase [Algibacillus agarilyticus]|uniref:HAD-IB family hydrolase n=1 Tax=Algibacillus agarilyticus TaxID=2234133 RepID=UPI0018E508A0|nr:HAD-IB family hydrolase [Algibacillus agarilyticus]
MNSNNLGKGIPAYKTLVCFDFDGTLTATNALHQLYIFKVHYYHFIKGVFWRLLFLIQIPYFFFLYKTDNKRFNQFLYSRYRGMRQDKLRAILEQHLSPFLWRQIFPAAQHIINQLPTKQTDIIIISASWSPVVEQIAQLLGVKYTFATQLNIREGRLTGQIIDFVDGARKAQILKDFLARSTTGYGKVIAYGNSKWDIPMLNCADRAYVVNPNNALAKWASKNKITVCNWHIPKRHWSIRVFLPIARLYLGQFTGWQHIPKNGGCIVIANHTSYLDHYMLYPLIGLMTGRRAKFISKIEHFNSPIFAKIISYLGAYPIDRDKGGRSAINTAIQLLEKGEIVVIYPEGTRARDGQIADFKAGVVIIQEKTQVPVLPIGIKGAFQAWSPAHQYPSIGTIDIAIGKLIPSANQTISKASKPKLDKKQRAAYLKQTVTDLC